MEEKNHLKKCWEWRKGHIMLLAGKKVMIYQKQPFSAQLTMAAPSKTFSQVSITTMKPTKDPQFWVKLRLSPPKKAISKSQLVPFKQCATVTCPPQRLVPRAAAKPFMADQSSPRPLTTRWHPTEQAKEKLSFSQTLRGSKSSTKEKIQPLKGFRYRAWELTSRAIVLWPSSSTI